MLQSTHLLVLRALLARSASVLAVLTTTLASLIAVLFLPTVASAQAKRVIIVKVDGLPYELLDRVARERDARTGKSNLPWIHRLFYEQGARVPNFYTRGLSLSAPSWALLETGQHAQIKGNIEYDRFTLHSTDYLNFVAFYLDYARSTRTDAAPVELLDEIGLPMLADAFTETEKYTGFELLQRGVPWKRLQASLQKRFTSRSLRELLDEWTIGFGVQSMIGEQIERDLLAKLADPRIRYLVCFSGEFDHMLHANRDLIVQREELQKIDALIGRLWTAVLASPLASDTVLVLVSDHGMNTDERIYSQGYDLVSLLTSALGGGHHVVTKRPPLTNYSFKGLDPMTPHVTTTSAESLYLRGQSAQYPTALLDLDGNERASLHLRESDLNLLHVLWQQLSRAGLPPALRLAATDAFFEVIERRRAQWSATRDELQAELGALRRTLAAQQALVAAQPKEWSKADRESGRELAARRLAAHVRSWQEEESAYTEYVQTLTRLLALRRDSFNPAKLRVVDFIAPRAMGEANTIHELQNYVVGLAPKGLTLESDGRLDLARSFQRLDYFTLLRSIKTRNNVQPILGNQPVDFVAARVPLAALSSALQTDELPNQDAVWLYSSPERQALLLARQGTDGQLRLRYLPIAELKQQLNGSITFKRVTWQAGLPLKLWEDDQLRVTADARTSWLSAWHAEQEWLRATHTTQYSNAVIGLHEHFAHHLIAALDDKIDELPDDARLLNRWRARRQRLLEADLLILANNHWNFNALDVNPGGNHGSFFRLSTHSTLMFAGGERTGLPRAMVIDEPYDSLSFAPTILALMGLLTETGEPVPALRGRGFSSFPGRVMSELLTPEKK